MGIKAKISSAVIGAAMLILVPFLMKVEGESLRAYPDPVGVWTICHGETDGVRPGDTMTRDECRQMTQARAQEFMGQVADGLRPDVRPHELAAFSSFAYNVGVAGFMRSEARRVFNAGDRAVGCRAMMNWYRAGGRDCRIRANGCYGLVLRRQREVAMCLGQAVPA